MAHAQLHERTTAAQSTKGEMDTQDYFTLRSFYRVKKTKNLGQQLALHEKWEKIFLNHARNKGLIYRIYIGFKKIK